MKSFEKVYKVVAKIPKGKVMTYGKVSELSGINNPRIVGFALHANKNPNEIPCHRVIRSDRTLANGYAFGGKEKQKKILQEEGIKFSAEKINQSYLFI